jgi:hypothetical protein
VFEFSTTDKAGNCSGLARSLPARPWPTSGIRSMMETQTVFGELGGGGVAEPVEIKVTLADAVDDGLTMLGLDHGLPRSIWFLEDLTPGVRDQLPLLSAGVVLRLRSNPGGKDDSTIKLRPCRRSQLPPRWSRKQDADDLEYRIEADWAGHRHALAASCVQTLTSGRSSEITSSDGDLEKGFVPPQLEFMAECADVRVNIAGLVALGPIAATRWKDVDLEGFDVTAERWTVGDLDFLELSIRVKNSAQAAAQQSAFEATIRTLGLSFPDEQETKTRQVLEHLAHAAITP